MAKVLLVTFDGSEDEILNRILSALNGKQVDTQIACDQLFMKALPNFSINIKEKRVYFQGKRLSFNHYEFLTFCYLAKHPNWVFSKKQIYEDVWEENSEHGGSAVVNVISQIRRKLKRAGAKKQYIETVVHYGYRFSP